MTVTAILEAKAGKTAWKSGDRLSVHILKDGEAAGASMLSCSADGAAVAFTGDGIPKAGDSYRFFFPADRFGQIIGDDIYSSVPATQEAVAGGVDESAVLLAGAAGHPARNVTMKNATAFVTFALGEHEAEFISTVYLEASSGEMLCGDVKISNVAGTPSVSTVDSRYNQVKPASVIAMKGPFEPGKQYTFSVVPGQVSQLALVLESKEGFRLPTDMPTGKNVSLDPGAAVHLGGLYTNYFTQDTEFFNIQEGYATRMPVVFIFLPDGFTEDDRAAYTVAAQKAAEYMFGLEPFKALQPYFTVYVAWTPSSVSGLGNRWGTKVDADGAFQAVGAEQMDAIYRWVEERCPVLLNGASSIDNVGIFLIAQDEGKPHPGVCSTDDTTGHFVATFGLTPMDGLAGPWSSVSTGSEEAYRVDYRQMAVHDGCGHGFGRFEDEHWSREESAPESVTGRVTERHALPIPASLNVSASATDVPWKNLDAMREELAARDKRYERLGTYEGGALYARGIWRPESVSAMLDYRPYFSTWERAVLYQRVMHLTRKSPSFNLVEKPEDLKAFLDFDLKNNGACDPLRD